MRNQIQAVNGVLRHRRFFLGQSHGCDTRAEVGIRMGSSRDCPDSPRRPHLSESKLLVSGSVPQIRQSFSSPVIPTEVCYWQPASCWLRNNQSHIPPLAEVRRSPFADSSGRKAREPPSDRYAQTQRGQRNAHPSNVSLGKVTMDPESDSLRS